LNFGIGCEHRKKEKKDNIVLYELCFETEEKNRMAMLFDILIFLHW
jgi:hypothetical protein